LQVLFSVWERTGAEACEKLRYGLQVCVPNR